MNTICSQCGSVLASGVHACDLCESPEYLHVQDRTAPASGGVPDRKTSHDEWRGELNERLRAYRARRRKTSPDERQSALPFGEDPPETRRIVLEERAPQSRTGEDDFAFTIAIGRMAQKEPLDSQVLIDVSNPPDAPHEEVGQLPEPAATISSGRLQVASLDERRHALLIDALCLAFAYGSFLALFGSLGGHFTLSKLSAAVCVSTFAFVYLQYFGLFTIFGGSTPGMMVSGLHVASVTGDLPTARQYALRAAGYALSAGACFLGFLWVIWDEDGLAWHDRISHTYLANVENFTEEDASHAAAR